MYGDYRCPRGGSVFSSMKLSGGLPGATAMNAVLRLPWRQVMRSLNLMPPTCPALVQRYMTPRRILFITATRVGDAVLSTGALAYLLDRHPQARVTVACGPVASGLFDGVPGLERVIVLEKRHYSLHWLGLWRECVGTIWDVVVDLRNAPLTYLILARYRYRMGNARDDVSHRIERLSRVMGVDGPPLAPRLWTLPQHERHAADLVPEGPPVLAVGPTANWRAKQWPTHRFAELIRRLTASGGMLPGGRVMFIGQVDERAGVEELLECVPPDRRIDLLSGAPLLTVYACLKRAAFYVGNDSGLMHMSAAAGTPTLGLFGPSREEHYAPWGPFGATVRGPASYHEIFPRGFDHRTSPSLMDDLEVDAVEAAARGLWNRTRGLAA